MLAARPFGDIYAIFTEAAGGGDFRDIDAPRNAPAKTPIDHLDKVKFHADFDYYQVAMGPTPVTVNHLAIPGATTTIYNLAGATFARNGQMVENQYDLVTHDLGYPPRYMVIGPNGGLIAPGTTIQVGTFQDRMITPFATSDKIRLWEVGTSSASTLAATSIDYTVLVFREPAADSDKLFHVDPDDGHIILGKGKFNSLYKTLRKAGPSASPFDISLGPTVHIRNGGARTVLADGTTTSDTNYSGSFAGSDSIQCAVQ